MDTRVACASVVTLACTGMLWAGCSTSHASPAASADAQADGMTGPGDAGTTPDAAWARTIRSTT